jgi:predicted ATPase/DNA-binding CsgD family transcriptional regulator
MNTIPNNLPLQLSSFIGREREIAKVKHLLATSRLVTLTGAGGCGKTRLALQVATDLLTTFADGVWLVEYASLADPVLVPPQVAVSLAVREQAGQPLLTTLTSYLRDKQALLILDNCEHLIAACAQLADTLLRGCPSLHLLATSREALNLAGEHIYLVPSLEPDPAVRLFIERATAAQAHFTPDEKNADAVAQICRRLDGIPLAIELAATRVKALSIEQIAARLDNVFQLLTGGNRTALPRQQTLRAAMDWSYDLLSGPERALFRRLSVFAGGWTLEAAEEVASGSTSDALHLPLATSDLPRTDVLDVLMHLVDKSLVVLDEQTAELRYRMLEPVRQYAHEKLLEAGEGAAMQARHLNAFLQFAEAAAPKLFGAAQAQWMNRLERDHDNLRAALAWALAQSESAAALRLSGALEQFWQVRGYWSEGRQWLQEALALSRRAADLAEMSFDYRGWYANVLNAAGTFASSQGDYTAAGTFLEESLALSRALGDSQGIASSLRNLGNVARTQGEYAAARALLEESLTLSRELGDKQGIAASLQKLGVAARYQGDDAASRALLAEGLALSRGLGDKQGIAASVQNLGILALNQRDSVAARALLGESLALSRELGDRRTMSLSLVSLGSLAGDQGDYAVARELFEEGLALCRESGYKYGTVWGLAGFARLAQAEGQPQRAARLLGALEALHERTGTRPQPRERAWVERTRREARAQLDAAIFNAAWETGRQMPLDEAIAFALQKTAEPARPARPSTEQSVEADQPPATGAAPLDALTSREVEVLRLVAQGLTDAQIAETLVISRRTVNGHLGSIYGKLNVTNRTAAARYAAEFKLR